MKTIVIRGPLGVGKSTVAKSVAEKIGGVYISVDQVLEERGLDKAVDGEGIPLANFLKANEFILSMTHVARAQGKPVIIDGNFYHESQIDELATALGDVAIFTLKASVETCLGRDAARLKSYGEDATRVVHMFVSAFDRGTIIETDGQTVKDTVSSILGYLS